MSKTKQPTKKDTLNILQSACSLAQESGLDVQVRVAKIDGITCTGLVIRGVDFVDGDFVFVQNSETVH